MTDMIKIEEMGVGNIHSSGDAATSAFDCDSKARDRFADYLQTDLQSSLEDTHILQELVAQVLSGRVKAAWVGSGRRYELTLTAEGVHIDDWDTTTERRLTLSLSDAASALMQWATRLRS